MDPISIQVNGRSFSRQAEPRMHLGDFLRDELHLTGTHLGCEHGVCGACTVLVDGRPMRSCLMFAVSAVDSEITTVEGLTEEDGSLVLGVNKVVRALSPEEIAFNTYIADHYVEQSRRYRQGLKARE